MSKESAEREREGEGEREREKRFAFFFSVRLGAKGKEKEGERKQIRNSEPPELAESAPPVPKGSAQRQRRAPRKGRAQGGRALLPEAARRKENKGKQKKKKRQRQSERAPRKSLAASLMPRIVSALSRLAKALSAPNSCSGTKKKTLSMRRRGRKTGRGRGRGRERPAGDEGDKREQEKKKDRAVVACMLLSGLRTSFSPPTAFRRLSPRVQGEERSLYVAAWKRERKG